jgi:flavodoxin I
VVDKKIKEKYITLMEKIGLFYGPVKGSTEKVAKKVADQIGNDKVDMIAVKNATVEDLNKYNNIIFGVSTIGRETWDGYNTASDWDKFRTELDKADFSDKIVAMFSLGDHITYPKHFVDALGWMAEYLKPRKARLIGFVDTNEYEFEESQGIEGDKFMGLPIDEDYEAHLTDDRIKKWLEIIMPQFK